MEQVPNVAFLKSLPTSKCIRRAGDCQFLSYQRSAVSSQRCKADVQRELGVRGERVTLVDAMADDPGDAGGCRDDGDSITLEDGHFGVDQDVLHFLFAA